MAEQHLCQRHGRPAIASRVRLRPDETQEIEYVCEIDLAEERMSGRLGGGRSLFDEFFSDFFDRSPAGGGRTGRAEAPARRAESVDVTQFFSDAKVAVDAAGDRLRFEVDEGAAPELLRERKDEGTLEQTGSRA